MNYSFNDSEAKQLFMLSESLKKRIEIKDQEITRLLEKIALLEVRFKETFEKEIEINEIKNQNEMFKEQIKASEINYQRQKDEMIRDFEAYKKNVSAELNSLILRNEVLSKKIETTMALESNIKELEANLVKQKIESLQDKAANNYNLKRVEINYHLKHDFFKDNIVNEFEQAKKNSSKLQKEYMNHHGRLVVLQNQRLMLENEYLYDQMRELFSHIKKQDLIIIDLKSEIETLKLSTLEKIKKKKAVLKKSGMIENEMLIKNISQIQSNLTNNSNQNNQINQIKKYLTTLDKKTELNLGGVTGNNINSINANIYHNNDMYFINLKNKEMFELKIKLEQTEEKLAASEKNATEISKGVKFYITLFGGILPLIDKILNEYVGVLNQKFDLTTSADANLILNSLSQSDRETLSKQIIEIIIPMTEFTNGYQTQMKTERCFKTEIDCKSKKLKKSFEIKTLPSLSTSMKLI